LAFVYLLEVFGYSKNGLSRLKKRFSADLEKSAVDYFRNNLYPANSFRNPPSIILPRIAG